MTTKYLLLVVMVTAFLVLAIAIVITWRLEARKRNKLFQQMDKDIKELNNDLAKTKVMLNENKQNQRPVIDDQKPDTIPEFELIDDFEVVLDENVFDVNVKVDEAKAVDEKVDEAKVDEAKAVDEKVDEGNHEGKTFEKVASKPARQVNSNPFGWADEAELATSFNSQSELKLVLHKESDDIFNLDLETSDSVLSGEPDFNQIILNWDADDNNGLDRDVVYPEGSPVVHEEIEEAIPEETVEFELDEELIEEEPAISQPIEETVTHDNYDILSEIANMTKAVEFDSFSGKSVGRSGKKYTAEELEMLIKE